MTISNKTLYIFDFDDTLITNRAVDLEAFNGVLVKHNLTLLTAQQLLALRKKGLVAESIFKMLTTDAVDRLVAERRALLNDIKIWKHAQLNTGVKSTLKKIKATRQPIVILTKKQSRLTKQILNALCIRTFIDSVYTSNEKHTVLSKIIQQYAPTKTVFVSDDVAEMQPMQALPVTLFCFENAYKNQTAMTDKLISSLENIL